MLLGVPKEIKDNEYRVGIVPSMVRELTEKGHRVVVESRAGAGAGFADSDYQAAGGEVVADSDAVFGRGELIVKVKEPLAIERKKLSRGQVLFTYLHLAPRDGNRLRDGDLAARHTAASYTNVGDRRAHGGTRRRPLPGKRKRGPRRSARRRAWCGPSKRRNLRRRCRRNERSTDCVGHGRRRYRA
jgi:Alanine dehydrogenase/PNT, N-terminal domain